MNLDLIKLRNTVDEFATVFAIDSLEYCLDRVHFKNYTKNIIYKFNQLGYRDDEWPAELNNDIWAVGDSFTVGLGQPFEEIWPQLVQQKIKQRIINVSMNGASNNWIGRRIQYILDTCNPAIILVQWSYLHRREHSDTTLSDEQRALHFDTKLIEKKEDIDLLDQADVDNLLTLIKSIKNTNNVRIVHSFIPNFCNTNPAIAESIYKQLSDSEIEYFAELTQVDFARDKFHYDLRTASSYAEAYIKKIQLAELN